MAIIAFLVGCGLIYLVLMLLSKKGENAVYGFLLIYLLFPKYIRWFPILGSVSADGVRPFDIVEFFAAAAVLLACIFKGNKQSRSFDRSMSIYLGVVMFVTVLTFVTGYRFTRWDEVSAVRYTAEITLLQYVRDALELVYGVVFAWGVLRFITTIRHVEKFFALFVLSGVELVLEVIFLYYLRLVPALEPWVVDSGPGLRFASLTFLAFDSVGLICIVAIASAIYFAISWRSVWFALLVPLMFLPIIGTLGKAPFAGAVLAFLATVLLSLPRKHLVIAGCISLAVWAPIAASDFDSIIGGVNEGLGRQARLDPGVARDEFTTRIALWLRGLDIFASHIPFGVGNGMVEYQMAQGFESHFDDAVTGELLREYQYQVVNDHVTNSHNFYVEFIAENGFFGAIAMVVFVGAFAKNFLQFVKTGPSNVRAPEWPIHVAQASLYGCAIGVTWRNSFEVLPRFYFIFLSMLVLSFILAELRAGRWATAAAPGKPLESPAP